MPSSCNILVLKMKKQNKQMETFKKITIIFSYSLFALLLVAVTLSTVLPIGTHFFNPAVHHFNIAVMLVSLAAGAVLPPLLSYLIGDRVTHSKSKVEHHFNGALFGIASYWLSLLFFFIGSDMISAIRDQFSEPLATAIAGWPIIATVVVMAGVAVGYVTNQKKHSVLMEYKPYQFVLFAGLIATFGYVLLNQDYTLWVVSVLYVVVPVFLIAVAYKLMSPKHYGSSLARLTGAVLAISVGFIASSVTGQLLMYPGANVMTSAVAGVVVLAVYLWLIRRVK
jgi:hypothetical protein